MHTESYFSQYGKDFQEKIFQCLLNDHRWAAQMHEVMTHEYFELRYLKYLCLRYFEYHHAANDRFDAINKRELELGAAAMTSLLYLVDQFGIQD